MTLRGQVALVTGAGSGIGAAIARVFGQAGAAVVALDIDPAAAEATATRMKQAGHPGLGVGCDGRDRAAVHAAVHRAQAELGDIDVLVHSAGAAHPFTPFDEIDPDVSTACSTSTSSAC